MKVNNRLTVTRDARVAAEPRSRINIVHDDMRKQMAQDVWAARYRLQLATR